LNHSKEESERLSPHVEVVGVADSGEDSISLGRGAEAVVIFTSDMNDKL